MSADGSADASTGGGAHGASPEQDPREAEPLTVLVYSDDRTVRQQIRLALGRRVARDLPPVVVEEVATQAAVIRAMDHGGIACAVLDGESAPGGMGICRQLKDEIRDCPPVLVITGRADDAWLATWSRADGAVPRPVDPVRLPGAVAALLRARSAAAADLRPA